MAKLQTKDQRETAIRYIVFILMLALMLQMWLRDGIKSFYSFTTPVALLLHGKLADGEVVGCADDYEYRTGGGVKSTAKSHVRRGKAPLAKSFSGEFAIGSYLPEEIKSGWCERQKGKQVKMLIHPTDASQNRISSFTQLWYIPFQAIIALFWVIIASRFRVLFRVTLAFNAIVIPAFLFIIPYIG